MLRTLLNVVLINKPNNPNRWIYIATSSPRSPAAPSPPPVDARVAAALLLRRRRGTPPQIVIDGILVSCNYHIKTI